MTQASAYHAGLQQARQKRQQRAKQRRLQKTREHLQREQARAQRHLWALEQALGDVGLPETLAAELEWRLKTLGKLLGTVFGLMFPTVFGCRTVDALTRVRRWDTNWPSRILGALPKQTWVKHLQRLGQEVVVHLWRPIEDKSPATRSRWPWTWGGDDSLCKKSGQQLGVVGLGGRGQEPRVRLGLDGLRLVVVMGAGKLVIPVDFAVRRPDPVGPGGPCRDQLMWLQIRLDRTWAALRQRCRRLPPPLVVADHWFGDSHLLTHVALQQQGTLLVEGKRTYVFDLPDGRRVTGQDLLTRGDWPWHDSAQLPSVRSVRLMATSQTYGAVTLVIVDKPGQARFYLWCRETARSAPRLIRAWTRRRWIEHHFRRLKHLLATDACQVQGENAYYGHLVLRLMAGLVLLYTARLVCKGQVTMEEILCSLKHDWRFLDSELLELHGLSWDLSSEAA
jgi:hypothetical protein